MSRTPLAALRRDAPTRVGLVVLVLLAAAAAVLALVIAPPDRVQGDAQRLMYLHVPVAWCAYLCFAIVLIASIGYLRRRRAASARVARAAAELGVVLTVLTLASGSVWGSLTWGTWWVWDGRTTSTVAMGMVYVAYLGVRALEVGRASRVAAAVVGVVGFAVVPVVHLSVLWWRTLHQPATLLAPSTSPPIHPLMAAALIAALATVTTATLLALRLRVRRLAAAPVEATAAAVRGRVPT